ncbi:DNA cytosine methyltransferase [Qipengyuania psychrotolerans]|uniref:Cytosine-specific methyltransferase n=1 Tax=Qipengyuania psychrotolerans TaxID=2867238 RepID=A0ABX8ZCI7_9SPHN|nr:DNA cytosine methyltransferase [Qipengyuania psychrotolerans]QZD86721.1 DNA cytosine methyltransferase [Qipengyuania psychrotolerans]
MPDRVTYIDLFAGCGGLSLGLEQAGFDLRFAVEKSAMAAETFYHNFIQRIGPDGDASYAKHLSLPIEQQASEGLVVSPLLEVLKAEGLLEELREDGVDLVAGGPPCQGFSLAGRRNPKDERNQLAWQFLEFVEAVSPKAVMIENVAGMRQDFRKHGSEAAFGQLHQALEKIGSGYCVQPMLINAMHFGAAQHRPRVMLVGLRSDVSQEVGAKASGKLWRSTFADAAPIENSQPFLAPVPNTQAGKVKTVKDAIADLSATWSGKRRSSYATEMATDRSWIPEGTRSSVAKLGPIANHNKRTHSERVELRFRLYQCLWDQGVSAELLTYGFQARTEGGTVGGLDQSIEELIRFPLIAPDGVVLAESPSQAAEIFRELATKKHSQRALSWDKPSPTVLSIPDDFVHPAEPRTMTVRELARFQSFPDAFEFRGKETTGGLKRRTEVPQYTQVGNAVPPKLALAVGMRLKQILSASSERMEKANREAA